MFSFQPKFNREEMLEFLINELSHRNKWRVEAELLTEVEFTSHMDTQRSKLSAMTDAELWNLFQVNFCNAEVIVMAEMERAALQVRCIRKPGAA